MTPSPAGVSPADQTVFSYYPGCTLKSSAREYEVSSRIVSQAMGIDLQEIKGWACCGASSAHSSNNLLALSLPSRDLHTATELGHPVVAACAMCFSRLKIAAHELEDKDQRKKISAVLGKELQASVPVVHLLEVLDCRSDSLIPRKSLAGLKVACYYGCLLVRPKDIGIDDAENPQIMDRLLLKAGAEPVKWAFKTECCGAGLPLARPDIISRLVRKIVTQARNAGADCISVACPECHANLDMHQTAHGKESGTSPMPVLYFTQLLGLALGASPYALHLDKHLVDPMPMLSGKGLA